MTILKKFYRETKKEFFSCQVCEIYMINKSIINLIPPTFYGFDTLMIDLLKLNKDVRVKQFDGYWLDIGEARRLHAGNRRFLK